ncbi:unannotated protein [freshwater metagenome]|uniref:Unannotated protein n=1 Tax=freshwater metagenome TaxID=449393 RepID=A0A6J6EPJ1_9ZZZZ|nr:hypothetical protein [Actinomycetota bacterium]
MSTTTNFKRIALVAVAALGLGLLNSAPSQAAINADTVTLSSATAAQSTAETYTATSAVVTVSFFGAQEDSMSITAALTAAPAGNTALPTLQLVETSSALIETNTALGRRLLVGETRTANAAVSVRALAGTVVTTAKFAVYLTEGNGVTAPSTAGSFGVRITPATIGASGALQGSAAVNLTITVTDAPALDKKVSAANSRVWLQGPAQSGNQTYVPFADSTVAISSAIPTAVGATAHIYVLPANAANTNAARESLTVTTNIGGLGTDSGAILGRSLNVRGDGTQATRVYIFPDGNAGVASISVTTASGVLLATKTVRFFGATTKLTGTAVTEIIGTSGTVRVAARDAADVLMSSLRTGENVYAFSSDATIATVPTTALSYSVDSAVVTVTGVKAGTATITFGNATTLAASTIKSDPVSIRVGSTAIASVTVAFDKQSYAPGEKATVTLSTRDATNLLTVPGTAVPLFVSTGQGLVTDKAFLSSTIDTATTITTAAATSATAGTVAGTRTYTVFMPTTPGPVKLSATLSSDGALATAIRGTEISATATVTDSGSAALAAVTALATTVASLRTLIVTLTNLVLKIQKKVRA